MVGKVSHLVSVGDRLLISHDKKDKLRQDQICFIINCEDSWIEKYRPSLSNRFKNIYPILKVVIRKPNVV